MFWSELKENDKLKLKNLEAFQHFTTPPARYSEAGLVKAMEEEFGVSAAAPVMVAGGAEGGAEESSTKTVELTSAGGSKIAVIKVIREITGLGLKEAKGLADNGGTIKENCEAAEADEIKAKLEGAGASVELK